MHILITTDTIGGVWTFTRQLSSDLLARGHHVALVSFGRPPSESQFRWCTDTAETFGSAFRYRSSKAPLEWMQNNERAYADGLDEILQLADEFMPEVMLSNQYCYGKVPLPIPKIIVAHSDVLSWSKACRAEPLPPSRWLEEYVRLVGEGLEAAAALVAPTHWMRSALAESFKLPAHSIVIPNGRTVPPTSNRSEKKFQAVTAGRLWDEAKNLALLEQFDSPMPILVAGSCEMNPATRPLNSPATKSLGELSETEVLSLFQESAIYICTSIYEPFGLAPLEAALCGCAVVANDIPTLREVWGDSAIFFRTPAELRSALQSLAEPASLTAAQSRSFERARQFPASRMTEGYLNLFQRFLSLGVTRSEYAA